MKDVQQFFSLTYFRNSKLTCIETFKGSDEHLKINFNMVKKNFLNNTKKFKDRLIFV